MGVVAEFRLNSCASIQFLFEKAEIIRCIRP